MRCSRLVPMALVALTSGALAPAAPVPKHLMPKQERPCFPTKVGDRHVSVFGKQTLVCVVAKVEQTEDGLVVEVVEEKPDGTRTHDETALVSASGVKSLEQYGKKLDTPHWWVKLPHAENNTWTDEWANQTRTWQTAGWEEVQVPAGKFRAIRVDRQNGPGQDTTTYWFAPGMGCIKWTNGTTGRELTEFTPGK